MKHLVVDGYLNGTGIRDKILGGYISPNELGVSSELAQKISSWIARYWKEFYVQYSNSTNVIQLDQEGKELAIALQKELPNDKIEYFSDAHMSYL